MNQAKKGRMYFHPTLGIPVWYNDDCLLNASGAKVWCKPANYFEAGTAAHPFVASDWTTSTPTQVTFNTLDITASPGMMDPVGIDSVLNTIKPTKAKFIVEQLESVDSGMDITQARLISSDGNSSVTAYIRQESNAPDTHHVLLRVENGGVTEEEKFYTSTVVGDKCVIEYEIIGTNIKVTFTLLSSTGVEKFNVSKTFNADVFVLQDFHILLGSVGSKDDRFEYVYVEGENLPFS